MLNKGTGHYVCIPDIPRNLTRYSDALKRIDLNTITENGFETVNSLRLSDKTIINYEVFGDGRVLIVKKGIDPDEEAFLAFWNPKCKHDEKKDIPIFWGRV